MKKEQIKNLIIEYLKERKVYYSASAKEIDNVAEELSKMNFITKDILLKYLGKITILIKESVDFSDTNYLLSQIVTLINSK